MSTAQMIETARAFLSALENWDGEAVSNVMHPDARRIEYPNAIKPEGGEQGLAEMLQGVEQGKAMLKSQSYAIRNTVASDTSVLMELTWTGVLAINAGPLPAGHEMRADCVAAFDIEGGKIIEVRNYDCFGS